MVSLVPSLTEAVASSAAGDRLVGATDWCTHPADLEERGVRRVRGTKNPDLAAIRDLEPDVVLANKEENRELDVRRLRDAGVNVWVTDIETVPAALTSLQRIFTELLETETPSWLDEAAVLWAGEPPAPKARVAVPIWRDPWMVVGSRTFTGDLAARLGLHNVFGDHSDRYPHVALDEVDRDDVDAVLLPDEPYVFTPEDGPEAFLRARTILVSGRLLTWYGPSLVEAHRTLSDITI